MVTAYLLEHPPKSKQYRTPRREAPSGVIVIHTAENAPDFVAFDGGAEAVARFIATRTDPGSYHELVDSDSAILMVPYTAEAFHDATGGNRHELSVSIATRADVWPLAPQAWRDGAVEQAALAAARQARWVRAETGIVVPATRITRDESERRVPGFISHAQRDPTRRTDPGKDFPWAQFLARYAELTDNPEDDDMADPAIEAQLDRIEQQGKDNARGIVIVAGALKALADDIPDNIAAELDELRKNLRTDLEADGVPADQIER